MKMSDVAGICAAFFWVSLHVAKGQESMRLIQNTVS
jgi:hypothetical protein